MTEGFQNTPKPRVPRKRRARGKTLLPRAPGSRGGAFRPVYVEMAKRICTYLGATEEELANVIGVDPRAIKRWRERNPDFKVAIDSGRADADGHIAERLYKRAMGWEQPAVKIFLVDEITTTKNANGEETTVVVKKPLHVSYVERFPPDTMAAMYWLNNRRGLTWRRHYKGGGDESSAPTTDNSVTNVLNLINVDNLNAEERSQFRDFLRRVAIAAPNGSDPPGAGQG
jgi:hypothetical protein